VLTVTNTNDSGPGSLREAMLAANNPGPTDRIVFNIPGAGVHTIQLLTPLPALVNKTAIDATTQPSYFSVPTIAGTPLVELDGTSIGGSTASGIQFSATAGGSSVRGLSIGGFGGQGVYIQADACTVAANHIGCNAAGTIGRPNGAGVFGVGAGASRIGGWNAKSRNVISGNSAQGVYFSGGADPWILGNYIGTNASGTTALLNLGGGVFTDFTTSVYLGGLDSGGGNLISGNVGAGAFLRNSAPITSVQGHQIYGNWIGTNVYGTGALGNSEHGLYLASPYCFVGFASASNVISANGLQGLHVAGPESKNNYIYSNFIGTTYDGTRPLGNNSVGLWLRETSDNELVGNVVGSNQGHGILISDPSSHGNVMRGNAVGTNLGGATDLGNQSTGIHVSGYDTRIGGPFSEDANVIAYNSDGVIVFEGGPIEIRRNRIYGNQFLSIDLLGNGITPNDAGDVDAGPNELLNFPVLESVTYDPMFGLLTIVGHLDGLPLREHVIDMYSSPQCNANGNGASDTRIVGLQVDTDGAGHVDFELSTSANGVAGYHFSATASTGTTLQDPYLVTSEFSPCVTLAPSVGVDPPSIVAEFALGPAYPQPARGLARIPFTLARESIVKVRVFDVAGREVVTLLDEPRPAGRHEVAWDAATSAPGIYWYRIEARPAFGAGETFAASRSIVVAP
jgi:parallel beta-helix repeat protein